MTGSATPSQEPAAPYLVVEPSYLSLTTALPPNPLVYGLGEHITPLPLPLNTAYTLWNKDQGNPEMLNMYGSHPFYMRLDSGGSGSGDAHGVLMWNSDAMDVILGRFSAFISLPFVFFFCSFFLFFFFLSFFVCSLSSLCCLCVGNNNLTYKITGGVMDLYFFMGPTPHDVMDQFTRVCVFDLSLPPFGLRSLALFCSVISF